MEKDGQKPCSHILKERNRKLPPLIYREHIQHQVSEQNISMVRTSIMQHRRRGPLTLGRCHLKWTVAQNGFRGEGQRAWSPLLGGPKGILARMKYRHNLYFRKHSQRGSSPEVIHAQLSWDGPRLSQEDWGYLVYALSCIFTRWSIKGYYLWRQVRLSL